MINLKDIAEMNIVVKLSLWSALKLRIAGITNYIANEKYEKDMEEVDKNVAEIRELARKLEQAEAPKKPKLLLEMFKVIADTYAAGEVNEAIQLLRGEISKAAGHYHNLSEEHVYREAGDELL